VARYSDAELRELGPVCGYVGGETLGPAQSRRAVVAGAILTTISPLLAQDGRLRVVVTDAAGMGVPYADVRAGDRRVRADEDGVAILMGLPVGRVEIVAFSPGFKTWRGGRTVSGGTESKVEVRLEVGSVGGGVFVEPVKAGFVEVVVLDPSKAAVAGAEVWVKDGDGKSRTGRDGLVTFSSLPAGKVQFEVRAAGFNVWRGEVMLVAGVSERVEVSLEVGDPGTKVEVKPSVGRRFLDWLTSCTRR